MNRIARMTVGVVAAMTTVALLGACGARGGSPKASTRPDTQMRTVTNQMKVHVTLTGASTVDYRGTVDVATSRFRPSDPHLAVFSVGVPQFIALDDGRRVRVAFDLAGLYRGPGRYQFGPSTASSPTAALSKAFIDVVELRDPSGPLEQTNVATSSRFDSTKSDCSLDVAKAERSGTLACLGVRTADGQLADLRLEWSA